MGVEERVAGVGVQPQAVAGDRAACRRGGRCRRRPRARGRRRGRRRRCPGAAPVSARAAPKSSATVGVAVDGERVALAGEALAGPWGRACAWASSSSSASGVAVAVGVGVAVGVATTASSATAVAVATRIFVPLGSEPRALPRISVSAALPRLTATLEASESGRRGSSSTSPTRRALEREAGDAAACGWSCRRRRSRCGARRWRSRGRRTGRSRGRGWRRGRWRALAREARAHGLRGPDLHAAHVDGHRVVGLLVVAAGVPASRSRPARRSRPSPARERARACPRPTSRPGRRRRGAGEGDERRRASLRASVANARSGCWLDGQLASAAHGGRRRAHAQRRQGPADRRRDARVGRARAARRARRSTTSRARPASRAGSCTTTSAPRSGCWSRSCGATRDIRLAALDAAIAGAHTGDDLLGGARLLARGPRRARPVVRRAPLRALHLRAPHARDRGRARRAAPPDPRARGRAARGEGARGRDLADRATPSRSSTVLLSLADGLALRMLADPGHDWGPTLAAAMPAARALLG